MATNGGAIVQTAPRFFEISRGGRKQLEGKFVVRGRNVYGFKVAGRDPAKALIIDPEIVFTSYFGGSGSDAMLGTDNGALDFIGRGYDVQVGASGIYITGRTPSANFPVSDGTVLSGSTDAFVMRLDPTRDPGQQLVYATFVGGSGLENGRTVTALEDGSAYASGWSSSNDFPTTDGVVQPTRARSGAYIFKLEPEGALALGTFVGRASSNHPNSIAYDKRESEDVGYIYLGGSSRGGGDATDGSYQTDFAGS
jgi:hypothetical protein